TTVTSLTGGSAELPFFLDASSPYTGAITALRPQSVGLAGRIAVNPGLLANPSRLVVYQTSPLTPPGDPPRPNFLYPQLNGATCTNFLFGQRMGACLTSSPTSGIGTSVVPFSGTVTKFIRQIVSQQGQAAESADNLKQGQDVVLNSLQQRYNDSASVNIVQEM